MKISWYALAAFLVPLGIRAIPEIIAGPYPIGFDTINSYVPAMLDWGSGNFYPFNPLVGGWFIFAVFGVTHVLTQADPIMISKVAGPTLYAILGVSEYFFARKSLRWNQKQSLLLVLIASIYFVSLRISWDLFRNTLGMALLLFALPIEREVENATGAVKVATLMWLVVVTHLLVATLLVALVWIGIVRSDYKKSLRILCVTPATLQYLMSLAGLLLMGIPILEANSQTAPPVINYAYPIYIFLPLLPLAALGLRNMQSAIVKEWLILCVLGIIFITTPISISSQLVWPSRWAWMMLIPLAVLAANGYYELSRKFSITSMIRRMVSYAWVTTLLVLGIAFLVLPAANAFPYYYSFQPTSMLQSTVPLEYSGYLSNALEWLSRNISAAQVLVVHQSLYGWAREFFHARNLLISLPESTLPVTIQYARSLGYDRIYTIWWLDGMNWYKDSYVPQGFALEHSEGPIGVYLSENST